MDTELRFLARLVDDESARLKQHAARERRGRGHTLILLLQQACDRIATAASDVVSQLPLANPAVGPSLERELFRLQDELRVIHYLLGHYRGDFGRQDLPVGLVHLVDELVADLLPQGADPIIHLGPENMYSTLAVVEAANQLWRGTPPPHPHPVGFNLPALNPANVMLAPILAHEVGHTAWRQGLDLQLNAAADLGAASNHLRSAASAGGGDPRVLAETFDSWRQELLCDALAAVLTGPSFLFASAVFLPITVGGTPIGRHPYPRDRVAYTLRIMDELGWVPFLQNNLPGIYKWCSDLASNVVLTGHPTETGLRAAISAIEPAMTAVALSAASNPLAHDRLEANSDQFNEMFSLEVPPTQWNNSVVSPWELLAAAWTFELRRLGDTPDALASVCYNSSLNTFLVKSAELADILRLWSLA